MFGLMKSHSCASSSQDSWYRLHYCGLCKTIGTEYGQKSRLFLNYDLVFLAELLSAVHQSKIDIWAEAYQSKKCFQLPGSLETPPHMSYVADVSVLLAKMKVADNSLDDISFLWKAVQRLFESPFKKVTMNLQKWGIDPLFFKEQVITNQRREDLNRNEFDSFRDLIGWYAEPTATMTGHVFSKGVIGAEHQEWESLLYNIGFEFGQLTYALDAWRDAEKDEKEGDFNPIFQSGMTIEVGKQHLEKFVWRKAKIVEQFIDDSVLEDKMKEVFISRLFMNLESVLHGAIICSSPNKEISESSFPVLLRKLRNGASQVGLWLNPLRPTKFAVTYLVLLFLFFYDFIYAVSHDFQQTNYLSKVAMITGLISIPLLLYIGTNIMSSQLKKHKVKGKDRLTSLINRLRQRIKKYERILKGEDGKKRPWWYYVLMTIAIIVLLFILLILITIVALFFSACDGECGDCCDGCECGECGCGDCDCDCNC